MTLRAPFIAAALACLSCASAGAAERKWYPAQTISGPEQTNAQAIMDREGGTLVLFGPMRPPHDLVHAAARPAGGEFSDPFVIDWLKTEAVGFAVTATFDSAGRALLIWPTSREDGQKVRYSTHHPETKQWITREFFPDAGIPVVAKPDGRGTILAAWVRSSQDYSRSELFITRMRHGSPFGKPERIAEHPSGAGLLGLDASRTGAAVLTWADFQGYRAMVQPPGGEFGSIETLPGASVGITGATPQAAIDDRGETLFAMRSQESGGSMQEPHSRVVVVVRTPDGEYLEPQTLSTSNTTSYPRIAAGPAGEAIVAWIQGPVNDASLRVSVRGPNGEFSPPETVADGGLSRWDDPQIGMDDAGNAIAAWIKMGGDGRPRVYAAHRPPRGSFGEPRALSTLRDYQGVVNPRLSVGGPGNAIVTWSRTSDEPYDTDVEAAVFDVDRPSVPEFDVEPETLTFRWKVSEQSKATIRLWHGGRKMKTVEARARAGVNRRRARRGNLPTGRYLAVLRARDGLGHRSKRRYARFSLAPR